MKTTTGYSGLQIALHWLIAVLILAAWLTGEGAEEAMEAVEEGGAAVTVPHMFIGLAILALVAVRILARLGRGAPKAPGSGLSVVLAEWGHRVIYLLMLAVPLGGIATWYLGLDLGDLHGLAANVLLIIALAHAGVALFHQYVLKDGLLRRMMRPE